MSDRADRYATAAAGSALAGGAGALVWRKGRSLRQGSLVRGAANRNFEVIRRAGIDARSEANAALEEGRIAGERGRRRAGLVNRTKSRLKEVGPNRYVQPGKRGFYPSSRLRTLQGAADADFEQNRRATRRFLTQSSDSRARLKQAGRMEADFGRALKDFGRSKKLARGGRAGLAAGVAGLVGFGAAAEHAKTKRGGSKPVPIQRVRPNVVDMARYRNARSMADDRGSLLVDPDGYRKQLAANAGSAWLKNHGRQS